MTGGTAEPAVGTRTASGWRAAAVAVLALTVAQLAVSAVFAADLPQLAGKGFGARLVAYPVLMLAVPAGWALAARRQGRRGRRPSLTPWPAFTLLMAPFLVDVTGNTLDLYDAVDWWDDANHLANWALLSAGIGLLLRRPGLAPWALGWLVTGLGALLAVGWEAAEWWAFIRHGTELDTAYTDTLLDEVLGCLGAGLAGLGLALWERRARTGARASVT